MKRGLGSVALALLWACTAAPTSKPTSTATPREASARTTPLPFHVAVAPSPSGDGAAEPEEHALAEALAAELDGRVFARATVGRDDRADVFLEWTLSSNGGVDVSLCDIAFEVAASSALLEVSMEAPVDVRVLAHRLADLCPGALFPSDDVLRLDWEALTIETEPARLDVAPRPHVTVAGAVEIPPTARLSRLRSASVVAVVPPGAGSDAIASGPTTLGPAELLPDGARRFTFRVEGVPASTSFLRLELVAGSRELVRRVFTLRVPRAEP